MDIKFIGDKKEYGMLSIKKQADAYSFTFGFDIDSPLAKAKVNGSGAAVLERGNVEITTPTSFETIK